MKWTVATITALLSMTGCAGLVPPQNDPLHRPELMCVARYTPLEPDVDLGYDSCGNIWERRFSGDSEPECFILSEDGQRMIRLPKCPAQGDTLYTTGPR